VMIEDNGGGASTIGTAGSVGTARQGSGQGLALHRALLAIIGGTLTVESEPDTFTRVSLTVPVYQS